MNCVANLKSVILDETALAGAHAYFVSLCILSVILKDTSQELLVQDYKMKPGNSCFPHIKQAFTNINAFRTAYTISCVVTIPFLLASIVGNLAMLFCLWKCRSLHPPFKALLRSLVISDLGVGLVVQPLFLASNYTALTGKMSYFCVITEVYNTFGYFLAAVSFVTTTSIAVDRFLAIQLRLRYRQFATLRRTHFLLVFIWVLCAVLSSVWIWDLTLHEIFRDTLMTFCITIACVSYIRVFMLVRRHQVGLNANQTQQNAAGSFHLGRYKKTVTNTIYVFSFLLMCYLPFLCLSVAARRFKENAVLSHCVDIASVLVFANSSFNPVLYCWRISEIRHIAKAKFGKLLCKI